MAKQVMDIKPGKGISVGDSKEQQRNWTEKTWNFVVQKGNYDRSREHLNFEVTKGGKVQPIDKSKSIVQKNQRKFRTTGHSRPKCWS